MSDEKSYEDEFDSLVEDKTNGEVQEEAQEEVEQDEHQPDLDEQDDQDEPQPEPDEAAKYREEVEQWKHRYNSDIGRINAYQRKIQELEQQLQSQPQPTAESNPDGSGMTDSEWETLKEDFPEIASALEKQLQNQSQRYEAQMAQMRDELKPIQEQAYQQFKQSQYSILEQQHPDWREVAQTNEFRQWLSTQPQPVQQLVNSDAAPDAAFLIQSYKANTGYGTVNTGNDDIRAKRQQQLRSAQTVPTRGTRKTNDVPSDYEDAFSFYADRVEGRR